MHAQQGDFDAAIETLERALEQKPDVAEANATLGVIYLKQGKLPEAEAAAARAAPDRPPGRPVRERPRHRPGPAGTPARGDSAAARRLEVEAGLRRRALPAAARSCSRRGQSRRRLEHLEAAVRVAPEDANIHYQLGRAYQALGRTADAEREFEVFRQLKDKSRGTP